MSASAESKPAKKQQWEKPKLNPYPQRCLRFWHGMRIRHFWSLMWRNRFQAHPFRWGMVFTVGIATLFNSFLYRVQWLFLGRKVKRQEIEHPPIFIVGHWRSGTTHLHELLVRDKRFAYPTTYECFAPHHFLISKSWLPKLLWFMMPAKRPMDNMAAGFDHPQEDEFALCAMGAPTPYERIAFPNRPPVFVDMLDTGAVSEKELSRFKHAMLSFVKALNWSKRKQLVMKSPPHTGRIKLLADMFPGAKFIHIVRDPHSIFPSMWRTWYALYHSNGFQIPKGEGMDEYIFDCYETMYEGFESQQAELDPSQICTVKYEELVKQPVEVLEGVYDKLELGDFAPVRTSLEEYLDQQKDYVPNKHQDLDPEVNAEIERRWHAYIEKYGYESSAS